MGSGKGGSSWISRSSSSKSLRECLEHKCHKPVGKFGRNKEYSVHCEKHACNFGARCKLSKHSRDKFCAYHSVCAWPTCDTKVLDVEGGNFLYSNIGHQKWYCRDHSCKAKVKDKQCYELPHKNSQYCEEHSKEFKCKNPKCDSDRDGSERYCKKHHCEVDDCHRKTLRLEDHEMAGRDKKKCYRHQHCEASRDCKNYSLWDPDKTPTRLCANHYKCQFLHDCNGFAQGDSRFYGAICTYAPRLDAPTLRTDMVTPTPRNASDILVKEQTVQKSSRTAIPTLIFAKLMPARTLHALMSQQSLVAIATAMDATHLAAVRPETAALHSSPLFADSMGKRDRKMSTTIIPLLLLEQHLARVAGLVAMTPDAFRGHFATSNTIAQHIRIRFRPQKLIVDMKRMITQMIITGGSRDHGITIDRFRVLDTM
ncbi:uncharacterized protein FFUJ_03401 [Fusarium fujikuroi IMI 58289]|uniref:Uncharacterized protein n=1 Tax=Gibberella fujikuroi (strain CBS 195.34 / IMI 58289 / NRRL A-6831) TaxID=1279085 RepID=S0DVZ4_GIBF5|nr:uncharacterized protein FFUJ_03401 [Fusarium fujikuroi IMI 58289]CCT66739.1 uncharacterized protein FFUJ_03401 [Fusarium fujikuroi IMI 58289]